MGESGAFSDKGGHYKKVSFHRSSLQKAFFFSEPDSRAASVSWDSQRFPAKICDSNPFDVQTLSFLSLLFFRIPCFFPLRGLPCFFFPSFPGIFGGSVGIKKSLFVGALPCLPVLLKNRKEGPGSQSKISRHLRKYATRVRFLLFGF